MVLMILGGSLYGGHRSLMKLRNEAEAVFYNGVEGTAWVSRTTSTSG